MSGRGLQSDDEAAGHVTSVDARDYPLGEWAAKQ